MLIKFLFWFESIVGFVLNCHEDLAWKSRGSRGDGLEWQSVNSTPCWCLSSSPPMNLRRWTRRDRRNVLGFSLLKFWVMDGHCYLDSDSSTINHKEIGLQCSLLLIIEVGWPFSSIFHTWSLYCCSFFKNLKVCYNWGHWYSIVIG